MLATSPAGMAATSIVVSTFPDRDPAPDPYSREVRGPVIIDMAETLLEVTGGILEEEEDQEVSVARTGTVVMETPVTIVEIVAVVVGI